MGQGLGDPRVDPRDDALGAEQAHRAGHLDEVVGGLGVHDVDAGDVHDGHAGLLGDDGLEQGLGHLGAALAVDDAHHGEAEDAGPDLDDRGGQLADGRLLDLDRLQLGLQIAVDRLLLGERAVELRLGLAQLADEDRERGFQLRELVPELARALQQRQAGIELVDARVGERLDHRLQALGCDDDVRVLTLRHAFLPRHANLGGEHFSP